MLKGNSTTDKMKLKTFLALVSFLFFSHFLPAQGPIPPTGLQGDSLRAWLKSNWYDGLHNQLGYTEARRKMYNHIDNHGNIIVDVYSGFAKAWPHGGTGTNPQPLNCEHTIPQSFFNYSEPMKSDIHHLFPVHGSVNSSRNNHPYAEIDDNTTSTWWIKGLSQSNIPQSDLDEYAEYGNSSFEPQESHKGNAARAVFYFYTMYPSQAGSITQMGDLNTLYQWHLQDPVDAAELMRNDSTEAYQGNRNPYIDHPDLVALAWSLTPPSSQLFISEYVEGSSYNKAIEISNLTGAAVNMSGYDLRRQTNGAGAWRTALSLSGMLSDGDVFVIAHTQASTALVQQADLVTSASAMTFNGNDPVGLFHNGTLIDIVGDFNGGSSNFAANTTLRRKSSIQNPNTSYTLNEWDFFPSNTFSGIGLPSKTIPQATEVSSALTVHAFPNPFQDQFKVDITGAEEASVDVFLLDLTGRIHRRFTQVAGEPFQVQTETLAPGMYFLQFSDGTEQKAIRLLKQ